MYMNTVLPTVDDYQALIEGLSAGADQPMYSAADWRPHLSGGTLSREFLDQLVIEWQPVSIPNEACRQIMEETIAHLAVNPGWKHLWGHILRVTGNALVLAPEAGVDPVYAFLLGILHDIGKLDELRTGIAHELIGALQTRKILAPHTELCPPEVMERIAKAIAKQSFPSDPFVALLHDADKLDKIGATGIMRRLTTDFGARHVRQALRQVTTELENFPEMHFPTARRLEDSKQTFTEVFLRHVRAILSWL